MNALSCPNCGAVHEPANPGITVIVCDRCDSTLYREDDVLRAGTKSIVAEPRGPVAVGSEGAVGPQQVQVIGRVQLSYPQGSWNEWYLFTADGSDLWLVEDEKRYALERPVPMPAGAHPGLQLGEQLQLDGHVYEVRETGTAVCNGGEGQVPRSFRPGEEFRFVDLAALNSERQLLLEFDESGEGTAFAGVAVDPSAIRLTGGVRVPPARAPEAQTIRCAQCGAPVTPPKQGDPPKTSSCGNCGAVLQLDDVESRVVGFQGAAPRFDLEVGDRGQLRGTTWEVVGRARYVCDGYPSDEYLLWAEGKGYLWLEKDNGHYAWLAPLERGPSWSDVSRRGVGASVMVDGDAVRVMAGGRTRLVFVDGALPWLAEMDQEYLFIDMAAAPRIVNLENDGNEVEVFEGEWISGREVLDAFGRGERWRKPSDVHIAQPNPWFRWAPAGAVLFALAFANGLLALLSGTAGTTVAEFTIPAAATGEQSVQSPPFNLDPANGRVTTVTSRAQVDNSWVWVDLALVDAETEDELSVSGYEMQYYHGVEGGESWSEGSRTTRKRLLTPDKGTYRLEGSLEFDRPTPVAVQVRVGDRLSRYNLCAGGMLALFGVAPLVGYFMFESRRREDA